VRRDYVYRFRNNPTKSFVRRARFIEQKVELFRSIDVGTFQKILPIFLRATGSATTHCANWPFSAVIAGMPACHNLAAGNSGLGLVGALNKYPAPAYHSVPQAQAFETMTLTCSAIVAEARSWIGTPYQHQASLKGVGCDCLGLLRGVWRAVIGDEPKRTPTPALSGDVAQWAMIVLTAYFGGRSLEKVARILGRK
jgi:cell wall-associated NlpC family hydrolase